MSDKTNQTSTDAIVRKITNLLEQQQAGQAEQHKAMKQLVGLQHENNQQISGLSESVSQLDQRVAHNNQVWQQNRSNQLLRKILIEVPPVVLAVLLAFGINSWWQQRRADINAEKAYRNIVSELNGNLYNLKSILEQEERYLIALEQEIKVVSSGTIYPDSTYGKGLATNPMQSAAWQTAQISNAIVSFEDSLLLDLARVYSSLRHQEELKMTTLTLDISQKYNEETLLPFLKTNYLLLHGHILNSEYTKNRLIDFLKKYGELEGEGKRDE